MCCLARVPILTGTFQRILFNSNGTLFFYAIRVQPNGTSHSFNIYSALAHRRCSSPTNRLKKLKRNV